MRVKSSSPVLVASAVVVVLLAIGCPLLADYWTFPAEVARKTFEFDKSKFVLEVDGTRNQAFPPHTLLIYLNDELVAKYRNVGFTHIYASRDNRFFVGLSDDGIPGTAFVIFDADGNLIREQKHEFMPASIYTQMSITRVRKWCDTEKPELEFKMTGTRLISVFIRGSNGRRYDLLQPDLIPKKAPEPAAN